jgi:hypothetical protein
MASRLSRRALLVAGIAGTAAAAARADDDTDFQQSVAAGHRQLFLDDAGISERRGFRRVVNQPERHSANPVVRGEHTWERASASVYGTALYEEPTGFRLWYLATPGPPPSGRPWVEVGGYRRVTNATLVALAASADGVRWEKPFLGQLTFEGSRDNNLVDIGIDNPEGISVLRDGADPDPARRYKALFWDRRVSPPDDSGGEAQVPPEPPALSPARRAGGIWVATSADGTRWKTHGPVLPHASDTTHSLLYDPRLRRFVAFGRFGMGRVVARTESEDFLHWSDPRLVLEADEQDGPGGQIYGMPTDLYEGLYLGMFWIYREGGDARIDTQLAVSRDGIRWQRVGDRQTFLPNAPEGAWDDGMSRIVGRFIVRDDTLYLYYSMVNGPHRSARFPNPVRSFPPAIGLATLRRDGFVSMDAGADRAMLLTRSFRGPGEHLYVNADARGGALSVAVCDQDGKPLSGFDRSEPLTTDAPQAEVRWQGAELRRLAGQPTRLRFTGHNCRLFSFWFAD